MLVEQKLPINVTPEANKLDDPAERERIVRVFDRGLDHASELRPADPGLAHARPRPTLGDGAMGAEARQAVSHAGRLSRRIPPAARFAARS